MKLFRRSLLVFLCLSIVCIFFSCGDVKDPLANETIEENNWLPLLSEEQYDEFGLGTYEDTPRLYTDCYENYIYYKGDFNYTTRDGETSSIYTIMRYDVRTGMSYPACRDAACTHLDESCVFYNAKGIVYFLIQGDTMYYISATVKPNGNIDTSIPGAINSYNLKTMKYKYITEWEACDEALMQYYDNCLYFAQVELHKNDNNYDKYIWSYNLKTDRKERLFKYGDNNDISPAGSNPFIVDEKGRMIFMNLPTDYYPGGFGETTRISFSYRNLKKGAEDITIVDTEEVYRIDPETFYSKGKNTPFAGKEVYGRVLYTIVDGEIVYKK